MTLSHAASLLTAALTVAFSVLFMTTGSLAWGLALLAAPAPMQLARLTDKETWSVGEVVRGRRDDHAVSDALDDALRGPLPARPVEDGDFFVPDCPRLDTGRWARTGPAEPPATRQGTAPAIPTGAAPASTPLR